MKTPKLSMLMLACALASAALFQSCKKDKPSPSPVDKEFSNPNSLSANLPTVSSLYEVLTVGKGSAISPPDRICSSSEGTLYFSSSFSNQIFQLTPTGKTTLTANMPNDGSGTRAIRGLKAGESGTVYAVLVQANQIVKIDQKKHITYIPVSIGLNQPNDLAIGPDSTLYIADAENRRIVKVTPNGTATVLAGKTGVSGNGDGAGTAARFNIITAIRYGADGNIYVLDGDNTASGIKEGQKLRKITLGGTVTTFFKLNEPNAMILDFASAKRDKNFNETGQENFFIIKSKPIDDPLDLNTMVSHLSNTGIETAITRYNSSGYQDGPADQALIGFSTGLTVKPNGIYIADYSNATVRLIKKKQ